MGTEGGGTWSCKPRTECMPKASRSPTLWVSFAGRKESNRGKGERSQIPLPLRRSLEHLWTKLFSESLHFSGRKVQNKHIKKVGWTPFPGEVYISGEATPPSNFHSLLPQAPCNLRSNVIYWDKGCLSLVKVHDFLRGQGCVNTGNVYLSMSHFLKVDYLTLKGWGGSSESILRKSWGSQLCHFQKSRGQEGGVGWGPGVQETLKGRVSMPLGSNLMSFLKFLWTDLGCSHFPIDKKTRVTFSSLSLSQCFPFHCSKKIFIFFQGVAKLSLVP